MMTIITFECSYSGEAYEANKRLIEIFEQKIKDKISEVWGVKEEVETV